MRGAATRRLLSVGRGDIGGGILTDDDAMIAEGKTAQAVAIEKATMD